MAITIPILTDFNGRGIDKGIAQFQKLQCWASPITVLAAPSMVGV